MELTKNEEYKFEVIDKLVKTEITVKEASFALDLTRQQIYRLVKIYRLDGKIGFKHKNNGRSSYNKIDDNIINEIIELYLDDFYDYNFEAFYDEIKDKYKISYDSLIKNLKSNDIISPLSHKKTIRLYNEKMKKSTTEDNDVDEKIKELYTTRQISFEAAHTRRSSNLYAFGQEVQMDACEKLWFNNIVTYLHLAVDKGTKKVLFAWFEYEEITRGYFVVLFNIIINYGIPEKIKTDNRNSFSNHENKVDTTQFGIICNLLDINLITTSSATAKANVERENSTFKNRLIAEMRRAKIKTIDEANEYVNNNFIPKINKKFSYAIDEKTSRMKENHYDNDELSLIISEKFTRIIDNASSIKYKNKYYVPTDPTTGELVCFKKGTECQFINSYNAEYWSKIENTYYKLIEIEDRCKTMVKESEISNINETNEKKKYIPPKNHPWRNSKL